ncbi:MAG: LacI family DNA-binding transcriptional regulator [Clostridia bacterium]|nr:LacI family DNA-binding transcriptional regulator [Clostridia bacterium]
MPTIKDVARAAGVSIATVSYVFNGVPKVGEKTRRKVLETARELGYIPHKVASQLASRHTRTLGAIFPYVVVEESSSGQEPNYYVTEVIWGIENTAQRLGYGLLIAGWGPESNWELPAMLRDGSVEGVFLTGGLYPTEFIHQVKDTGIPAVLVGVTAPENMLDSVSADNEEGAFQAVKHLISLGHRRIGFINSPAVSRTSEEKARGVRRALRSSGIKPDPDLTREGDFSVKSGYQAARDLLTLSNPPTALFVGDDAMAVGALEAARGLNLEVPGDVAIVGYGDGPMSRITIPPLTTVRIKRDRLGEMAVRCLIDRINGINDVTVTIKLTTKLVVRSSCGAK